MPPRRRKPRGLTDEDRALWDRVSATAVPLEARKRDTQADRAGDEPAPSPAPRKAAPLPGPSPMPRPPRTLKPKGRPGSASPVRVSLSPDPMDALRGATPNMDAKTFGRLKRGKLAPEARIDLHGMSAERAHAALRMFIADAYARQLRLVLVITGKGRRDHPDDSPSRRGVLRNELPHWLAQPPLSLMVLQTAPAHIRHGGGGAYYVYLRRRR
ncbi:Smr/MutS family protein [Halovulum sp. GXIMD14794]